MTIKIFKAIKPLVKKALERGHWRSENDYASFCIFLHDWFVYKKHPEFNNKTCFEVCCEKAKGTREKGINKIMKSYSSFLRDKGNFSN